MARPATKPDLIKTANAQFEKLWNLIDSMADEERAATFNFGDDFLQKQKEAHWTRDENLRDVLIHLHEWHKLLLNWITTNQGGDKKPFLPAQYNWKTYGQMNLEFWEKHQATSLDNAVSAVKKSHVDVMKIIDSFPDDKLFEKGSLPWTGTSTLGSYCVSATASHYDWAIKKLKQHDKTFKEAATA